MAKGEIIILRPIAVEAREVKRAKVHPRLDGRFVEVVENVRRQLDVTVLAVEFEDTVGGGGLGVEDRDMKSEREQ